VVEEHRTVGVDGGCTFQIAGELVVAVDDLHRPSTEDVGRPHQDGEPELIGSGRRLLGRGHHPTRRLAQTELGQEL
jgi:hypothetical protein